MNHQLRNFYLNWLAKSDGYNGNSLSNYFDRFTSLYVAFNALYLEVATELKLSGHPMPNEYKERRAAVDYVVHYLKASHFIPQLLNSEANISALSSLIQILENQDFHIVIEWGVPKLEKDTDLLDGLRSQSKNERAKAILRLFYHVRCNLFHGEKDFEQRQISLLGPVNILLRRTLEITFAKLDE